MSKPKPASSNGKASPPQAKHRVRSLPGVFNGKRQARFAYLVTNGVLQAVITVASALLIKRAFNTLVDAASPALFRDTLVFSGLLALTVLLNALLRWRGHIDAEMLGQSYVHAVRVRLFQHVARIGADGARQMSKGALMLRFVGDLSALRQWVSLGIARLTVSGLAIAIAIVALFVLEPVISIAVSVAVAITFAAAVMLGKALREATFESRRRRGKMAAILNDRISRIGVVEAFGQEKRERRRFRKLSRNVRDSLITRSKYVALLRAISEGGAGFASIAALLAGAVLSAYSATTPGAVVSAMVVAGLMAPKINDLGRVFEYWNAAKVARQKQEELLQLQPVSRPFGSSRRKRSLGAGPGEIRFRKAQVEGLIAPLDLKIDGGARTAVIGPNGAGKSTLLRLAAGILQPSAGRVLLDGQDLARTDWEQIRSAFSIVSPDLPLLRGSLELNLTYGASDPDPDRLDELIESCGLTDLLRRLPAGLKSRLSENGEGLSSGEKARIALVRALMVNARVLLLDEAEANLDNVAQNTVKTIFDEYDGTVIAATHDLSLARRADLVVCMRNGVVESVGAPDRILSPAGTHPLRSAQGRAADKDTRR